MYPQYTSFSNTTVKNTRKVKIAVPVRGWEALGGWRHARRHHNWILQASARCYFLIIYY